VKRWDGVDRPIEVISPRAGKLPRIDAIMRPGGCTDMKCRISLLHILFSGALVLVQACSSSGSGSSGAGGSGVGGSSTGGDTGTGGAGGMVVGGLPGAGGSTHTGVWNVMMLGDSVTQSTCYPQLTYQQLQAANHTNFQFVGTQTTNQACGGASSV
jgi:hypothetical protein